MSPETFANILFGLITFSWMMYLSQEVFISGSSALNRAICKDEGERKQVQVAAGIHWDGIEVWLIASLTLMFAVFPLAFTTILTYLYVPFYLLLFAIIGRGLSIELIYKMDSQRWIKNMALLWTVSSLSILFILGVYMSNIFLGLPIGETGLEGGFMSIFNVTGISGGLLFLSLALIAGSGWLSSRTEGDLGYRALKFNKKIGIVYTAPIFVLLVFMGFNNTSSSIFIGALFTNHPFLFILPILTVVFAVLTTWFGYKENGTVVYRFARLTIALFVLTGFVGSFPYLVFSRVDNMYGVTIYDAMVSAKTMNIVMIALFIFYPVVIGYQTWKFVTFSKKVKYNDK